MGQGVKYMIKKIRIFLYKILFLLEIFVKKMKWAGIAEFSGYFSFCENVHKYKKNS